MFVDRVPSSEPRASPTPAPVPQVGSISGTVFEDENNASVCDRTRSGVTILLKDGTGVEVVATTLIGAGGTLQLYGYSTGIVCGDGIELARIHNYGVADDNLAVTIGITLATTWSMEIVALNCGSCSGRDH